MISSSLVLYHIKFQANSKVKICASSLFAKQSDGQSLEFSRFPFRFPFVQCSNDSGSFATTTAAAFIAAKRCRLLRARRADVDGGTRRRAREDETEGRRFGSHLANGPPQRTGSSSVSSLSSSRWEDEWWTVDAEETEFVFVLRYLFC
ncbi:hypothetical protein HZH68_015240 [Vespula germanica]|uniref:Uncharacterized protein n=1 Tax=Vespula germanica TaxID=30212 RepID=A0A834JB07_VESGE|nr:hypothetical protein HZH68_015240 [Vespula germanica]